MISLKKGFFALSFGVGLAVSLNAWAAPSCDTCLAFKEECAAGDASACSSFIRLNCGPLNYCLEP